MSYLLGLLAMIKCSICSYQCDNWYVSNWRLACHINFYMGRCFLELAQKPSSVALAWHFARSSTPFGVTNRSLAFLSLTVLSQLLALIKYSIRFLSRWSLILEMPKHLFTQVWQLIFQISKVSVLIHVTTDTLDKQSICSYTCYNWYFR